MTRPTTDDLRKRLEEESRQPRRRKVREAPPTKATERCPSCGGGKPVDNHAKCSTCRYMESRK